MTARARLLIAALAGCAGHLAAQSQTDVAQPKSYGTSAESDYAIDASELSPNDSITTYQSTINVRRWVLSNTTLGFLTRPHLPYGALVTSLRLDYFDSSPTGEVDANVLVCDTFGANCQLVDCGCNDHVGTLCSGALEAAGNGSTYCNFESSGLVVDDYQRRILIQSGNSTHDGSTAISRIVVGYKLQVSPAPSSATYSDVPTTHPFFQFVEALAKSGITGGCGGGKFCPDAPLTRGQMAVFLAKALGLQSPR